MNNTKFLNVIFYLYFLFYERVFMIGNIVNRFLNNRWIRTIPTYYLSYPELFIEGKKNKYNRGP